MTIPTMIRRPFFRALLVAGLISGSLPAWQSLSLQAQEQPQATPAPPATPPATPTQPNQPQATTQPVPPTQPAPPAGQASPPRPRTLQPRLGNIQSDVTINGLFVPVETFEYATDFKAIQGMRVIEAVPHGSTINAGDVLIEFKTDGLKDQVENQERTVESLRLALEEAELDAKLAEQQIPMNKEQAELAKQQADEDYKYYLEIEKALAERGNEERLKSSKNFLEYSAEELRQLEQMYKADDLTEESEEIVLRRAKDDYDRSKFSFEQTEANVRKTRELTLPRSVKDRANTHRLAEIAYERFKATFPINLKKRELALAKTRQEYQSAKQNLDKLKLDLKACEVKAPMSGVVYYGRFQGGRWVGAPEVTAKLSRFGTVTANEPLLTIVNPNSLRLVGSVSEADVTKIRVGMAGKATPGANKSARLDVAIGSVASVPSGDGSYRVSMDIRSPLTGLVAGMSGSAKVITYFNAQAITLPAPIVLTDEIDDTIRYVNVLENGSPMRKNVEVGVTQGDKIEIKSGLRAKDEVIVEKPAEKP
jgi:HlyD family secretion protein